MKSMSSEGTLLVISGPTGAGKDAVMTYLQTHTSFRKLPTYTTRPPRPNEENGIHYHFISEEEYFRRLALGEFLDSVTFSERSRDYYYGLRTSDIVAAINAGNNIYLHLVYPTALALKSLFPFAILVFLLPPSRVALYERLRKRGWTDSDIHSRIFADPNQTTDAIYHYDLIIVNHDEDIEGTASRILNHISQRSGHEDQRAPIMESMDKPTHFATSNPNKLREVNQILGSELSQADLKDVLPDHVIVEPQAVDVHEVIRHKARQALIYFGRPVLVEDTSLEFSAWGGLPGALIKSFLQSVGTAGLLRMMAGEENRSATAISVFGYCDAKGVHVFEGKSEGTISITEKGENGFGWDTIFIPSGQTRTYAEMNSVEKNDCSMRMLALAKLRRDLQHKVAPLS